MTTATTHSAFTHFGIDSNDGHIEEPTRTWDEMLTSGWIKVIAERLGHGDPRGIEAQHRAEETFRARYPDDITGRAALAGMAARSKWAEESGVLFAGERFPSDGITGEGTATVWAHLVRSDYVRGYGELKAHLGPMNDAQVAEYVNDVYAEVVALSAN